MIVAGFARKEDREWIGSRVVSVEGVPLQELLDRQWRLRGIDNQYRGLKTLVLGDYEFSWSYVKGEPIAKRWKPPEEPLGFRYLRDSSTFWPEFESGEYAGYYSPKQVIVLCDAGPLSAGFSVVATFHRLGAIWVGTPSAQAPNSSGAAAVWRLQHAGIRGMVQMIAAPTSPTIRTRRISFRWITR